MYTKKTLQYFRQPKNCGKIENANGIGRAGNTYCGDITHFYIKVSKNRKGQTIIRDIKFETLGCVAALATSSMISELAKGKTIAEALKISKKTIIKKLGGLPPVKIHCSVMAVDALNEAIYDYLAKNKKPIPEELCLRHQRIEKEQKIIEQKYKDWLV